MPPPLPLISLLFSSRLSYKAHLMMEASKTRRQLTGKIKTGHFPPLFVVVLFCFVFQKSLFWVFCFWMPAALSSRKADWALLWNIILKSLFINIFPRIVSIAEDLLWVLELCSKSMNTRDVETRQKLIAFKSNVNNIFVDIETCSTLVETEYGCNVFTRTVDKSPR